jgi:hypothetical protein
MAYLFTESRIMPKQSIASASSTKNVPLGTIVKAYDSTYGEGEFIYLNGGASITSVGVVVQWTGNASVPSTFTTTKASSTSGIGANTQLLAVSMVACVAGTYGWFQIAGLATVRKIASIISANRSALGLKTTLGRVGRGSASGKQVLGMRNSGISVAAATSTLLVFLDRPHVGAL